MSRATTVGVVRIVWIVGIVLAAGELRPELRQQPRLVEVEVVDGQGEGGKRPEEEGQPDEGDGVAPPVLVCEVVVKDEDGDDDVLDQDEDEVGRGRQERFL